VVDVDVETIEVGDRVRVKWEDQESGVSIPLFRRA
jgi:hypothetical protein